MTRRPMSSVAVLSALLCAPLLHGADFAEYRGFRFGMDLVAAAKLVGVSPSEATTLHQRPAVIQELEWRPTYPYQAGEARVDPVRDILLRFYNGELFQMVTTYDRQQVEGITEADMIRVMSQTYGTATKPAVEISYHSNYGDMAPVIAQWGTPEYSYSLIRTGDRTAFALVLASNRLNVLAEAAIEKARRLDNQEAPQRAAEELKRKEAASRSALDKARAVNLPNFRP